MRILVVALLVLGFLSLSSARAADATGDWRLDDASFDAQLNGIIDSMLAELPETMRAQMRQMMQQALAGNRHRLQGVARLSGDGSVVFEGEDGGRETGAWEDLGGDKIRLIPDEPAVGPIDARIEGDRMILQVKHPEIPIPLEMVWVRQ